MSDNTIDFVDDEPLLEEEVEPEVAEEVEPEVEAEPEFEGVSDVEPEVEEDIYATDRTWHEYPVFQCPSCAFDSIERDRVQNHVTRIHTFSEPPKLRGTQLYDRFNNPLSVPEKE